MRPGETEAGSAGTQPCRGITRWKLIEEDERGTASTAVLPFFLDFDRFPHALKIPAAKRRNTSYRKTATLHFTLNQDTTPFRLMKLASFYPGADKRTGNVEIASEIIDSKAHSGFVPWVS